MKLIATALLTLHTFAASAEVPPELWIAVVTPTTSRIQHVAQDAVNGLTLALHRPGAVVMESWQGKTDTKINVKVDFYDDMGSAASAESVARVIAARRGYHAVIGGINSGTAIPAAKIYEDAGLINISLNATNPMLTRSGHRWAFRMAMDDDQLARSAYLALAHRLQHLPALFVHDATHYGQLTAEGFANIHNRLNGQAVALIDLGEDGSKDFASARSIQSPDAVLFVGGMDRFAINVVRQLPKTVRWTIVGGDGICTNAMAAEVMNLRMHLICASQDSKGTVPTNAEFDGDYRNRFGKSPSSTAMHAFDATVLLIQAFGMHGDSGAERVRDNLRSGHRFRGIESPIAFDEHGDNSLAQAYLYELEHGKLTFTEKIR